MLVFSMEQNSDYRELLSVYEKKLGYSFRLLSDADPFLYQSENLENCSEIIDTFVDTLQYHRSYALSPLELKDCERSSQSAAYTVHMPNGKNYDGIYCEIVTGYGITFGLSIVKESDSFRLFVVARIKVLYLHMVRRFPFYHFPVPDSCQDHSKTNRSSHAEPERLYRCRFP